tara:strand:+ start:390 stop:527 length:138 start_codon:yes stop_codon:yes gene_type:complete
MKEKRKDFVWINSIFDDDFLMLHTRCVAEMAIARECHKKFNHCLN